MKKIFLSLIILASFSIFTNSLGFASDDNAELTFQKGPVTGNAKAVASITDFTIDPQLEFIPSKGMVEISSDSIILHLSEVGVSCLGTDCPVPPVHTRKFKVPIESIETNNCHETRYVGRSQKISIEGVETQIIVTDHSQGQCNDILFSPFAPTEVQLKISSFKPRTGELVRSNSVFSADPLIQLADVVLAY